VVLVDEVDDVVGTGVADVDVDGAAAERVSTSVER
jgi:hypothetical protein